jgi:hypothetical protein
MSCVRGPDGSVCHSVTGRGRRISRGFVKLVPRPRFFRLGGMASTRRPSRARPKPRRWPIASSRESADRVEWQEQEPVLASRRLPHRRSPPCGEEHYVRRCLSQNVSNSSSVMICVPNRAASR